MLRNIRKIFVLGVLTVGLCVHPVFAQNVDYAGTSVANFLKIGIGARAAGMADAYITESNDAFSLYWNPGTISRIGHPSLAFSTINWLVGSKINYASAVIPFSIGSFGVDIDYFGTGDIEQTTIQEQDGTGRYFNASDMQLGLAYARNMTNRFSFGMKVKYIRETLASVNASAVAFDIGSLFITNFYNNLRIGISLTNFGQKMQFDGRDLRVVYQVIDSPSNKEVPAVMQTNQWELPLSFRFGIATDLIRAGNMKLSSGLDILDTRDHKARENLGFELNYNGIAFLRGGTRFGYDEAGFSFGGGANIGIANIGHITADYAYTDFGRLQAVQQFSLALAF